MATLPDFLQNVSLLQDLDRTALSTLGALLVSKQARAGTVIFRELEDSDALYLVEAGEVVISKHVQGPVDVVLTTFCDGDFFGEMGLFDAAPRSATAQAKVDSVLWRLDRKAFMHILSDHPEIAAKICYRLVAVFIERLRSTNEQAREAVRWGLEATGYSPAPNRSLFDRKST
jgi:CRP/FNR family transcriptional regulator, cyclic AMP receptor protein